LVVLVLVLVLVLALDKRIAQSEPNVSCNHDDERHLRASASNDIAFRIGEEHRLWCYDSTL
jgi:hypothetical protein